MAGIVPGVVETTYEGTIAVVAWRGGLVCDEESLRAFVEGAVIPRLRDSEAEFEEDLRGLATADVDSEFLQALLSATRPTLAWEIGEALAEVFLANDAVVAAKWPWNTARDRRTPGASLPGADLVGFGTVDGETLLLIGEVKTSSQQEAPPNVMYGRHGMIDQLIEAGTALTIQRSLLEWLHARCLEGEARKLYVNAARGYLSSAGKRVLLSGVLVRDTGPDQRDLEGRAVQLSSEFGEPTVINLTALYLPASLEKLAALVNGTAK